jgi:hypothetical protein
MPQERLSVRKIRDLLRLHLVGGVSSRRQLGRAVGGGKTAMTDCLRRAAVAGPNVLLYTPQSTLCVSQLEDVTLHSTEVIRE